jgi:hypothetical protein
LMFPKISTAKPISGGNCGMQADRRQR